MASTAGWGAPALRAAVTGASPHVACSASRSLAVRALTWPARLDIDVSAEGSSGGVLVSLSVVS
eukprot:scaffold123396_cov30-Tisochrysis_lutea.AAC.11